MPKCGHSFHLSCIDVWLRKQSTCPVCRLSVHGSSENKHTLAIARSFNNPEALPWNSQQWLLPAAHRSEGNFGIYQGRAESGSGFSLEPVRSELAQARLWFEDIKILNRLFFFKFGYLLWGNSDWGLEEMENCKLG